MLQLIRRPAFLPGFAALIAALVLFWLARRVPLTLVRPLALDAPTAFLVLVIALGATLAIASDPHTPAQAAWRAQLPVLLLFPLIRIFAVGPIHTALLVLISLGGATGSLWLARSMLTGGDPTQRALTGRRFFLAIALASLGLASSAGVVAACAALLCYAVLPLSPQVHLHEWQRWAIAGALPFSAPFVAAWLAIGAATAAGATALAAVLWLAAILRMVAVLVAEPRNQEPRTAELQNLRDSENQEPRTAELQNRRTGIVGRMAEQLLRRAKELLRGEDRSPGHLVTLSSTPPSTVHHPSSIYPIVSIALGALAPPVVALLIQPVVAQLQAGLTPYGNLSVSPWIGLALLDSGSRGVTTAPLLAAALLMVVIGAVTTLLQDAGLQRFLGNKRTKKPRTKNQEPRTTEPNNFSEDKRTNERRNKGQLEVSNPLRIQVAGNEHLETDDELLTTLLLSPAAPNLQSPGTLSACLIESVPWLALLIGQRGGHDLR
jgi:hypothetical protein